MSGKKYRVHANEGFVSDLMGYWEATRYAGQLYLLGNVDVQVVYDNNQGRSAEQRENDLNDLLDALIGSTVSKYCAVQKMAEKLFADVVENDGSNGEQLLLFPEMDEEGERDKYVSRNEREDS